jgi:hypothetical protein
MPTNFHCKSVHHIHGPHNHRRSRSHLRHADQSQQASSLAHNHLLVAHSAPATWAPRLPATDLFRSLPVPRNSGSEIRTVSRNQTTSNSPLERTSEFSRYNVPVGSSENGGSSDRGGGRGARAGRQADAAAAGGDPEQVRYQRRRVLPLLRQSQHGAPGSHRHIPSGPALPELQVIYILHCSSVSDSSTLKVLEHSVHGGGLVWR